MRAKVVWLVASRTIASLAQALMLVLLARQVPIAEFGSLSALLGIGAFVSVLLDLGLTTAALRQQELPRHNPAARHGLRMVNITSALVLAIVLVVWTLGATPGVEASVAVLVALWLSLERAGEYQVAVLLSDERERFASITVIARRVLPLACFLALPLAVPDPSLRFALSLAIGAAFANAMNVWALRHLPRPPLDARASARVLREAVPFWSSSTTVQGRELEPWVVQSAYGAVAAGSYGVAFRLSKPFLVVAGAVAQALVPTATRRDAAFSLQALRRVMLAGLAMSLVAIPVLPFVPELLSVLLGDDYRAASIMVGLSLVTAGLVAVGPPLEGLCQALGREHAVAVLGWVFFASSMLILVLGGWLGVDANISVGALLLVYVVKSVCLFILGHRTASARRAAGSAQ